MATKNKMKRVKRIASRLGITVAMLRGVQCPYCEKATVYTSSEEVYRGHFYGHIYLCRDCSAWVGVNPNSGAAKGTIADAPLRRARKLLHELISPLFEESIITHKDLYRFLAVQMKLPIGAAQFAFFDIDHCREAWVILSALKRELLCVKKSDVETPD